MATVLDRSPTGANLEDRDLILHVRHGDERCLEVLLKRHRNLVGAVGRRYFLRGHDRDDVLQEGTIGLYKAIRDYDPDQETPFRAFAQMCISRQILTAVKGANRHKHSPLNTSASIDAPRNSYDTSQHILSHRLVSRAVDPANFVIAADEIKALAETLRRGLTRLEGQVLHLFMDGKSYEQIASKLGGEIKHVDNALQRIRLKVKRHLDDRDSIAS